MSNVQRTYRKVGGAVSRRGVQDDDDDDLAAGGYPASEALAGVTTERAPLLDQPGSDVAPLPLLNEAGGSGGQWSSDVNQNFAYRYLARLMPVRYLLAILVFIGFMNVYALRVNLSVAIVAMVKPVTPSTSTLLMDAAAAASSALLGEELTGQCTPPNYGGGGGGALTVLSAESNEEETSVAVQQEEVEREVDNGAVQFVWSEAVQSQILAAFFYGYSFTQLLGGHLAYRFGAHRIFCFGVFCTAALTLLTPTAAYYSPMALFALRFLEGFCEGVTFPAMHVFWSLWAPLPERSRLVGISYAGAQFGTILAIPLTSLLAIQYGWPSVFYVFGGTALIWCVLWIILAADEPAHHAFIQKREVQYILANSDNRTLDAGNVFDAANTLYHVRKLPPTPWRQFFKSAAVYAICLAHFGNNWGVYAYLTELPSYMHNVLKYSLTANGFLSALPYCALWLVQISAGVLADKLRMKGYASNTTIRKALNAVALFVPAIFLALVPLAGCDHTLAVGAFVIALGFMGFAQGGYMGPFTTIDTCAGVSECTTISRIRKSCTFSSPQVNHIDIASEYAGVLMAVSNTLATIPGFLVPLTVARLVGEPHEQTFARWSTFFYISAGVFVITGIAYVLFASGERLPWLDGYLTTKAGQVPLSPAKSGSKKTSTAAEVNSLSATTFAPVLQVGGRSYQRVG